MLLLGCPAPILDLTENEAFRIADLTIVMSDCSDCLIWLLEGQWEQLNQWKQTGDLWNCMERQNPPTLLESVTDTEISGNPCTRTSKVPISILPITPRFLISNHYTYLHSNLTRIWLEVTQLWDFLRTKSSRTTSLIQHADSTRSKNVPIRTLPNALRFLISSNYTYLYSNLTGI